MGCVDAERHDDGTLRCHVDTTEYLVLTQSLGWLTRGLNRLQGEQFQARLGATEERVEVLVHYLLDTEPPGPLVLRPDDLVILDRALSEIVSGPAEVPFANTGEPDWELIGGITAEAFTDVRNAVRDLARRD